MFSKMKNLAIKVKNLKHRVTDQEVLMEFISFISNA